jgi:hypothetical protein
MGGLAQLFVLILLRRVPCPLSLRFLEGQGGRFSILVMTQKTPPLFIHGESLGQPLRAMWRLISSASSRKPPGRIEGRITRASNNTEWSLGVCFSPPPFRKERGRMGHLFCVSFRLAPGMGGPPTGKQQIPRFARNDNVWLVGMTMFGCSE